MAKFNLGQHIANIIKSQGRNKNWVADQLNINEKTFYDKLYNDRITGYELLQIGLLLNIDLNELKEKLREAN